MTDDKNCPFYGRQMFVPPGQWVGRSLPFVLLDSHGNQCGLQVGVQATCWMEVNGQPVDWRPCPYVTEVRIAHVT
jgi:hypothetical protein